MYAVLKTGGKQYKVSQNDVIIVERLGGESGAKINLDKVLMIGDGDNTTVGTPIIDGALVAAEILEHKRGDKITVFKKKRRKNYRRTMGHRQELTVLRITDILAAGEKKPAAKKAKAESKTDTPKETKSKAKAQTKADTSKADAAKAKRTSSKKTVAKKEK
jgi:large subunit ribosomal protein L21